MNRTWLLLARREWGEGVLQKWSGVMLRRRPTIDRFMLEREVPSHRTMWRGKNW